MEAVACLGDVLDWAAQADDLMSRGRTYEARHLLSRIRKQAAKAQEYLRAARDGEPSIDRDVLEQVGEILDEQE
jgi:hypothetical protein